MVSEAPGSALALLDVEREETATQAAHLSVVPVLRLEALEKRYGSRVAVAGLNLELDPGVTLGLLGPNGAGKTTTMHLIAGLIEPSAGRVVLAGGHAPSNKIARSLVGIAPQSLALYPDLSARENLRFFGALFGLRGPELTRRVSWGLALARLEDRGDQRVDTFSGGMQRRLNLACALLHRPKLLLLDEPTAGVDPQSRNYLFDCIEQLQREGLTIVYSTHYIEEAERLCDEIAVIDGGKIVARGSVRELVERHGGAVRVEARYSGPAPALGGTALCQRDRVTFMTEEPMVVVDQLMRSQPRPRSLSVREPDLESVFLNLTGKCLRD